MIIIYIVGISNTVQMNSQMNRRSITPPARANCNIIANIQDHLSENEFPVYNKYGLRNCPMAPPRAPMEIRTCYKCSQVWQLVTKTSPYKVCSYCNNH